MLFQGLCLNSCLFTSESLCGSHYILSSLRDEGPYIGILITPMSKLLKTLFLLEFIYKCVEVCNTKVVVHIFHIYILPTVKIYFPCAHLLFIIINVIIFTINNYILFYDQKVWLYEYIILYIDLAGPWM